MDVLSLSSIKSIIYCLFSFLKYILYSFFLVSITFENIPHHILQQKQSERLVIASIIFISRVRYLLICRLLTLPINITAAGPVTQLIPYLHTFTIISLLLALMADLCLALNAGEDRSSCIRCSWSWRPWRDRSVSCLGSRPSWGSGEQCWKHPGLTPTSPE